MVSIPVFFSLVSALPEGGKPFAIKWFSPFSIAAMPSASIRSVSPASTTSVMVKSSIIADTWGMVTMAVCSSFSPATSA